MAQPMPADYDPFAEALKPSKGGPMPADFDPFEAKGAVRGYAAAPKDAGIWDAIGRSALQGASLNTSDEAWAAAQAAFGKGTYADNVKANRSGNAAAAYHHPLASALTELGASLAPTAAASLFSGGTAAPVAVATTAQKVSRLAQIAKMLWAGAKPAAIYSGIAGAAGADVDPEADFGTAVGQRLGAGVGNALVGGTVGAVAAPAIDLGLNAVRKAKGTLLDSVIDPKGYAAKKSAEAIRSQFPDAVDPYTAFSTKASADAAAYPKAMTGDVLDPNGLGHRYARASTNIGNDETPKLTEKLRERAIGQFNDISDSIGSRFGNIKDIPSQLEDMKALRQANGKVDYAAAEKGTFSPSEDLKTIFDREVKGLAEDGTPIFGKSTYAETLDAARTKVLKDLELKYGRKTIPEDEISGLPGMMRVRQYIDRQIKAAKAAPGGASATSDGGNTLTALQEFRAKLDGAIKSSQGTGVDALKIADARWSKAKGLEEALSKGVASGEADADAIRLALKGLSSPEQKQHFLLGFASKLAKQGYDKPDTNNKVQRFWTSQKAKDIIQEVFPNPDEFRRTLDVMNRGAAFKNAVEGNSSTIKQAIAQKELAQPAVDTVNNAELAGHALSGRFGKFIGGVIGRGKDYLTMGLHPDSAAEYLKFMGSPAAQHGPMLDAIRSAGTKSEAMDRAIRNFSYLVGDHGTRGAFVYGNSMRGKLEDEGAFRK